jgi:hypothetical protein
MDQSLAVLLTIITAATPLLIAAMGELVVERSGVQHIQYDADRRSIEQLLADYFEIDLKKVEQEKRAILQNVK